MTLPQSRFSRAVASKKHKWKPHHADSRRKKMPETVARIWMQHRRNGLSDNWDERGWPAERFYRSCRMLNCSAEELAALCAVTRRELLVWLKGGRIPGPMALHCLCFEQAAMEAKYGKGTWGSPVIPFDLLQGGLEPGPSASLINSTHVGSNPTPATTVHRRD